MTENEFVKIENLLKQVSEIRKKANKNAEERGENFNIFQVLKLETDEVKLHTRLIMELLHPKGKHGFGAKPLELFVKVLKDNNDEISKKLDLIQINFEKAMIRNKYLGKKEERGGKSVGGDIDIFIEIGSMSIAIENKIKAKDQNEQLIRYYNSLEIEKINSLLFYLTLNGRKPSFKSTKNKIQEGSEYFLLSYEKDIMSWLELCLEEAFEKPILRETIRQYIILIKKLTGQLTTQEMDRKLINLIINNYAEGKLITDNWNEVLIHLRIKVVKLIKQKLLMILPEKGLYEIEINENKTHPALKIKGKEWGGFIYVYLESKKSIKNGFEIGLTKTKDDKIDEILNRLPYAKEYKNSAWIYKFKRYDIDESKLKNLDIIIIEISNEMKELVEKVNIDWNKK